MNHKSYESGVQKQWYDGMMVWFSDGFSLLFAGRLSGSPRIVSFKKLRGPMSNGMGTKMQT